MVSHLLPAQGKQVLLPSLSLSLSSPSPSQIFAVRWSGLGGYGKLTRSQKPLYFPQDSELEVSMWRQPDDTKVWYEWMVEAYAWAGPNTRVKVGASELHFCRVVACWLLSALLLVGLL